MFEFLIDLEKPVNLEKLDEDMRLALGAVYGGLSLHGRGLRVHLDDNSLETEFIVNATLIAHDHLTETVDQQREKQRDLDRESINDDVIWSALTTDQRIVILRRFLQSFD